MNLPCPRCGMPNRVSPRGELCCAFCSARGAVSPTRLRRVQREAEVEERRERRIPANIILSAGLFLTTAFFLLTMFGGLGAGQVLGEAAFWLFPVWTTALVIGGMYLLRFDRLNEFALARRAIAVILGVLLLPMVYQALPRDTNGPGRPQAQNPLLR